MGKFDNVIIVSDVDGTFLGQDGRIVPENVSAVRRFKEEGGSFAIATGREHFLVPPSIPAIAEICNIPIIACNGAYIYDYRRGQIVFEEFLPEPEISRIVEAARRRDRELFLRVTCDGGYLMERDFSEEHRWLRAWSDRIRILPYEQMPHGRWHKVAWTGSAGELTALRPVIDAQCSGCISMLACPTILEVQSAKGTKGAMLSRLKSLIGKENAVLWAIGDYENDLDMLNKADRRAMPRNGIDSLRTLPGMVEVCDHDDGAIAGLIEYIDRHLTDQPDPA